MVNSTHQPLLHIERPPETRKRSGLSKSTQNRQINEGLFPTSVLIGARCIGFVSTEVDAVLAARIAGKSDNEIKTLVSELIGKRKDILEASNG